MSPEISLSSANSTKRIGFASWMERVLEESDHAQSAWDPGTVHDLRVALRRCRTMAEALSEVYPGAGWRKIKRASKPLFHALGDLRDTQVERDWIKKLGPARDPVRVRMLRALAIREKQNRKSARQALDRFDRKEWKKLGRKLDSKARFFPIESVVFQRLALSRLNKAVQLYEAARKGRSTVAWHHLRIGIKSFRYVVENFLPQRYEVWADDMKVMQDLLGEVHDLDVLRGDIRRAVARPYRQHDQHPNQQLYQQKVAEWIERIKAERKARIAEFLSRVSGDGSVWLTWRAGFQWGHALVAASFPERRTA